MANIMRLNAIRIEQTTSDRILIFDGLFSYENNQKHNMKVIKRIIIINGEKFQRNFDIIVNDNGIHTVEIENKNE